MRRMDAHWAATSLRSPIGVGACKKMPSQGCRGGQNSRKEWACGTPRRVHYAALCGWRWICSQSQAGMDSMARQLSGTSANAIEALERAEHAFKIQYSPGSMEACQAGHQIGPAYRAEPPARLASAAECRVGHQCSREMGAVP